jgi:hypothetical protein
METQTQTAAPPMQVPMHTQTSGPVLAATAAQTEPSSHLSEQGTGQLLPDAAGACSAPLPAIARLGNGAAAEHDIILEWAEPELEAEEERLEPCAESHADAGGWQAAPRDGEAGRTGELRDRWEGGKRGGAAASAGRWAAPAPLWEPAAGLATEAAEAATEAAETGAVKATAEAQEEAQAVPAVSAAGWAQLEAQDSLLEMADSSGEILAPGTRPAR